MYISSLLFSGSGSKAAQEPNIRRFKSRKGRTATSLQTWTSSMLAILNVYLGVYGFISIHLLSEAYGVATHGKTGAKVDSILSDFNCNTVLGLSFPATDGSVKTPMPPPI